MDVLKECSGCKQVKDLSKFSKGARCKACCVIASSESRRKNPEVRAANRLLHKESELEKNRQYKKRNKELINSINRARKARCRVTSISRFDNHSHHQIKQLYSLQGGECAICNVSLNEKYHVDHIMPISKGGSNDIQNIQILCIGCNLSKGSKTPLEFMLSKAVIYG